MAEIGRLAVVPDHHGQRLGTRLLAAVEEQLPATVESLRLFTGERSTGKPRLYARLGYRESCRELTPAGYRLVHLSKARQVVERKAGRGPVDTEAVGRQASNVHIQEVALTVAVRALTGELGLPTFPPQEAQFAPVGNHDGLIILVDQNRIWFPTDAQRAARGPVTVVLAAPQAARLSLRRSATVVSAG